MGWPQLPACRLALAPLPQHLQNAPLWQRVRPYLGQLAGASALIVARQLVRLAMHTAGASKAVAAQGVHRGS